MSDPPARMKLRVTALLCDPQDPGRSQKIWKTFREEMREILLYGAAGINDESPLVHRGRDSSLHNTTSSGNGPHFHFFPRRRENLSCFEYFRLEITRANEMRMRSHSFGK